MKRLALSLVATAIVGTGCFDNECTRSVTLQWNSNFRTADGTLVGCSSASADINFVDVYVNDQPAARFDCSAAEGTVPTPNGSNLITVEGVIVDVNNVNVPPTIVYRDEFNSGGNECGNELIPTQPAEGRVNIDYSVSSAPPCANGPCYVWFSVFDNIANGVAATVNANVSPTLFPYPNNVVFRLPVGSYTVDWMDIVSGGVTELASCTSPSFSVSAGASVGEEQIVPAAPIMLKTSCP